MADCSRWWDDVIGEADELTVGFHPSPPDDVCTCEDVWTCGDDITDDVMLVNMI